MSPSEPSSVRGLEPAQFSIVSLPVPTGGGDGNARQGAARIHVGGRV
jgi:hypothetical protein